MACGVSSMPSSVNSLDHVKTVECIAHVSELEETGAPASCLWAVLCSMGKELRDLYQD